MADTEFEKWFREFYRHDPFGDSTCSHRGLASRDAWNAALELALGAVESNREWTTGIVFPAVAEAIRKMKTDENNTPPTLAAEPVGGKV